MSNTKLLKAFNNYSNDCIRFKLIFDENDIKEENEKILNENSQILNSIDLNGSNGNKQQSARQSFKPEFTHQIFGDDENIFGYRNLRVDYFLTPGSLEAYIGLNYKEKIKPQRFEGIEADDVIDAFTKFGCSPGFTTNIDLFCSEKLKKDLEFKPYGNKIHEYKTPSPNQSVFEIYKVDSKCPEISDERFLDYIDRIQTMLVYYIETSNFIDSEDQNWSHFILYEKTKSNRYVTCGYVSVYHYYAYPDKTRARVSQMFILPNYQHQGHGSKLLESVYTDACQLPEIIDVVAESPSDEFMHLRDYVTSKMCSTLDSFRSADLLKKGFSQEMAQEALRKFKLSKLQSRRCYEILRLAITNQNKQDEWRDYRLDLKKRLYTPFIRRTKYARNSAAASGPEQEPESATTIGFSTESATSSSSSGAAQTSTTIQSSKINSAFMFTRLNTKSNQIKEEDEESEHGTTTIGFGSSSSSVGFSSKATDAMTARFNGGGAVAVSSSKSVKFSSNMQVAVPLPAMKKSSLNTSNSTTDDDGDDEEDGGDDDDNDQADQPNMANLLISPEERKKYLEDQFQLAVSEYRKVLKRLEL